MSSDSIAAHLATVQARIREAAIRAGRDPASIALLAVSKKQPASAIRAAHAAGQTRFGESYVQEALDKIAELDDLALEWHFIGRIQSNKTRVIAEHFDWVHGLCDAAHARRLNDQRPSARGPLNVCLQVNLSGEASKGGVEPDALAALLDQCRTLAMLRVRGLMTLPAPAEREAGQREPFRLLREWRERLATAECPLESLSMGMSHDLEAAILEGATLVRIGTAVFGPRPSS